MGLALAAIGYNQARFIPGFLERLRSQREYFDEVLLIDNCGSDDSERLFRESKLGIVLRRGDPTTSGALNDAMRTLKSEWVMPAAVDDLLTHDAGAKIRATLAWAPSNAGMIFCGCDFMDDAGRPLPEKLLSMRRVWPAPSRGLMQLAGLVQPSQPGSIHRRKAFLSVGARPEEWVEDYGISLRVALRYPIVEAGETWAIYRRTAGSWSSIPAVLDNAAAATRQRIIDERWPNNPAMRRFARSLAAYSTARLAVGQRDPRRAIRFSLESLRLAPFLPLGLHTAAHAAKQLMKEMA
jgi:glycosyltransferase involved in cell wall biosynthesis